MKHRDIQRHVREILSFLCKDSCKGSKAYGHRGYRCCPSLTPGIVGVDVSIKKSVATPKGLPVSSSCPIKTKTSVRYGRGKAWLLVFTPLYGVKMLAVVKTLHPQQQSSCCCSPCAKFPMYCRGANSPLQKHRRQNQVPSGRSLYDTNHWEAYHMYVPTKYHISFSKVRPGSVSNHDWLMI